MQGTAESSQDTLPLPLPPFLRKPSLARTKLPVCCSAREDQQVVEDSCSHPPSTSGTHRAEKVVDPYPGRLDENPGLGSPGYHKPTLGSQWVLNWKNRHLLQPAPFQDASSKVTSVLIHSAPAKCPDTSSMHCAGSHGPVQRKAGSVHSLPVCTLRPFWVGCVGSR